LSTRSSQKENGGLGWRLFTVSIVVFFVAAGIYVLLASTRESKRLEQNLNDRFGWAEDYTPAADGKVSLERLEAFLRVRQAVQPSCSDYQEVLKGIIGLGEIETDAGLSGEQKASKGIGGLKSMVGVGPKMLQFMDARNGSLEYEEMGLGEYIYIYMAVYGEQLADTPSSPYAEMEEAYISSRTRDEYVQILENQLIVAGTSNSGKELQNLASDFRLEILRLEGDSQSSPWPNGPPEPIRKSLAPLQDQLSGLFCEGLVSIELLQKNRGFSFQG
jgi:hypothetical protein